MEAHSGRVLVGQRWGRGGAGGEGQRTLSLLCTVACGRCIARTQPALATCVVQ